MGRRRRRRDDDAAAAAAPSSSRDDPEYDSVTEGAVTFACAARRSDQPGTVPGFYNAKTRRARDLSVLALAVEAAARVVDALVEAATRRSTRHGGCVSSDKSTDGHAAWDGEWRRVDVPE